MKITTQAILFPLIMIAIGVACAIFGLRAQAEREELARSGVSLTGQVVGGRISSGSKGRSNYALWVTWEQDGAPVKQLLSADKDLFRQHIAGTKRTDENEVIKTDIPVQTLPGRPDQAIVAGGSSSSGGLHYLGYFLIGMGLFLFYLFFPRRTPPLSPAEEIRPAPGDA